MPTKEKMRPGIQSVEVAGRILSAMIKAGRPAALKDLARLAGMTPGKAHRYFVSLVRLKLVSQDAATGHYGVGPMAIALGQTGMRRIDVVRTAMEFMPRLRDETDETIMLIIWASSGPIIYGFEESARPVFVNVRVGSSVPMLRSAVGQIFAAFLPPNQTRDLIQAERERLKAAGSPFLSESAWARQLDEVRKIGLAAVTGDLLPGIDAVAAPIFNDKGRLAAVIGALGRSEDIDVSFDGTVAAAVRNTAGEISRRIGFLR
jgi:DNA-binding IclR family transcriptional regulator